MICSDNQLTSLEYAPKIIRDLFVESNKISSLVGIHKHIHKVRDVYVNNNPIDEGGMGLLLIQNIRRIYTWGCGDFEKAAKIINKYLGKGRAGLIDCQDELIEAGLERFAKL